MGRPMIVFRERERVDISLVTIVVQEEENVDNKLTFKQRKYVDMGIRLSLNRKLR